MKIAILTSKNQWFVAHSKELCKQIKDSQLFYNHQNISDEYDIVFILSYHKIIKEKYLKLHKHNIVIHSSALPKGKGWAPLFWQVLEGKSDIIFTIFEASTGLDNGDIYFSKSLKLTGYELNNELRQKQANMIEEMCVDFLDHYEEYKISKPQSGEESFFAKRTKYDSELDINKTIKDQFNLLRIVDNDEYPAFFEIDGNRYTLTIKKD